jgi:hypothetical protein
MKALEIAKENGATTVLVTGIGSPLTANKLVLKKIVGHLQYPYISNHKDYSMDRHV